MRVMRKPGLYSVPISHVTHYSNLFGVVLGRQRRVVALLYLLTKRVEVHLVPVEGGLQSCHFVEEAAQRPGVGLEVIPVLVDSLRGHVVGCSNCEERC